jgi:hypothetical protein
MKFKKNIIHWRDAKFPAMTIYFDDNERSEQFPLPVVTVADIELFFAIEHDMNAQCKEAENIDHGIFYYMDSGTVAAVHEEKLSVPEMFRILKMSVS